MKKHLILGLALMIGSFSFAQKKELKAVEKAIKNSDYTEAKSAIKNAEALMSAMDDKTKAKFYYLKGQVLYANGAGSKSEITDALNSFKTLKDIEAKSGKKIFTPKVDVMKQEMNTTFIKMGSDAFEQKNYSMALDNFENAYRVSINDTVSLYKSATLANFSKDESKALKLYDELLTMGYTGITNEYMATEIETGEEQTFANETVRSFSIKAGTHEKARNVKTESKVGEMAKNVALIYVRQGENEKAIAAIEKAKETNPNDINLIISEANIYYEIGNIEKYKELIKKALDIEPNNVILLFNLGVFAGQEKNFDAAKGYYEKVMKLDPTYINAQMNMAALILSQEESIMEEMNNLGSSAADDKKYDELKEKRKELYKEAIPYLNKVLENESNNLNASKTLMNIYSAIDDIPNFKIMKAKVEALENGD